MNATVSPSPLPQELFEPFAHARVGGARETLAGLWPTFADEAIRVFLEGHRERLRAVAPELETVLRDRIGALTLRDAWHPTVGLMARPAGLTKFPVSLATNFGLHLAETPTGGTWSAVLEPETPIRVRNLIARPARVEVALHDTAVSVRLVSERVDELELDTAGERELQPTGPFRRVGTFITDGVEILVTSGAIPGDVLFVDEADPVTDTELAHFAADVRRALAFLGDFAPEFVEWVDAAVTTVVPCRAPDEMMLSGSSNTLPGLLRVTADRPPPTMAEMLVHEASHQYLHAGLRVAPVDDGSDSNLYFSPVKQEHRPIDKILTAYHAFANVELMYETARDNGWQPSAKEADAVSALPGELDQLERPLRETQALTPFGRALFDTLLTERAR